MLCSQILLSILFTVSCALMWLISKSTATSSPLATLDKRCHCYQVDRTCLVWKIGNLSPTDVWVKWNLNVLTSNPFIQLNPQADWWPLYSVYSSAESLSPLFLFPLFLNVPPNLLVGKHYYTLFSWNYKTKSWNNSHFSEKQLRFDKE